MHSSNLLDAYVLNVILFIIQNRPLLVEPIDFEAFIVKNRTVIQNDPHRELLLYPADDVMVSAPHADDPLNGISNREPRKGVTETLTRFADVSIHRKSSNPNPFARQLRTFQPCQRTS